MEATLPDKLQRWNNTRTALDHAIQNYLDNTIALQSNLHSATSSMHNTKAKTWLDRITNPANDSRFVQAQTHLDQIRNSFLSINTLPLEILLRIFRFAAFRTLYTRYNTAVPNRFERDDPKDLLVLTHVCTHWRKAMLGAQSFWSHFEFSTKSNPVVVGKRAQAYLERTPDAPLSLYINDTGGTLYLTGDNPLLDHLGARLDRLTRLTLMDVQSLIVAKDIIMYWMKNGKPGTLRTLILRMAKDYGDSEVIDTRNLSVTRERADSLLASIRVLYLNGLRFNWDSPAYHNLVVLRIGGLGLDVELSPYIHEMVAVLSACPQLHTLQLSTMSIRPSNAAFEPVFLTELEHFSMLDMSSRSFSLLLPAIFAQSQNFAVRLSLPHTGRLPESDRKAVFDSVCLFLARTNTTRLFIQQWVEVEPYSISSYLSAVPNLHTLILHFSHPKIPRDTSISGLIRPDKSNDTCTPLCPQLHTIYLIHAPFSIGTIQRVVEAHHIQKLRFLDCTIDPPEDELRSWLQSRVEDIEFRENLGSAESADWYHLMD